MADRAKTAVITGGGNGIGRETALLFLENGYNVVVAGRRADKLEETLALAGPAGGERGLAVVADVTDEAAVKNLFAETVGRFGRVDFLFNNAGVTGVEASGTPLTEVSVEGFRRVLDINVVGVFLCCREAVKIMTAQNPRGGRIVNNGSVAAQSPRVDAAPYTASKSAITGLTRSIALDYRDHDIACGQIDIGNAATEQASRHAKGSLQGDGTLRKEALMSVKDVARSLLYMADLPLDANVLGLTIFATRMPFVGRG